MKKLALIGILFLSACGFQPLHGQAYRQSLTVDLTMLTVNVKGSDITPNATSTLPRRYGELLKAEIIDQVNPMGEHGEKLYRLNITFTEMEQALFVNPDGTASRGDLIYNSFYELTRIHDAKVVASGTIQRTSSYNTAPTADYASYVSIEDARKRGVTELAQDYKLRLASLLPTLNTPGGSAVEKPKEAIPELQPLRSHEDIYQRN
jgi:hypothetical protein